MVACELGRLRLIKVDCFAALAGISVVVSIPPVPQAVVMVDHLTQRLRRPQYSAQLERVGHTPWSSKLTRRRSFVQAFLSRFELVASSVVEIPAHTSSVAWWWARERERERESVCRKREATLRGQRSVGVLCKIEVSAELEAKGFGLGQRNV
jgi:hypothetical protein